MTDKPTDSTLENTNKGEALISKGDQVATQEKNKTPNSNDNSDYSLKKETSFSLIVLVFIIAFFAASPAMLYGINKFIVFVPWNNDVTLESVLKNTLPQPPTEPRVVLGSDLPQDGVESPSNNEVVTKGRQFGVLDTVIGSYVISPYESRYGVFTLMALFSVATSASILGVLLSLLTRGATLVVSQEASILKGVITVTLVASISATILVMLFLSGIISGELFPNIHGSEHIRSLKVALGDWAKLTIWAFISGFYERFIPNTLDSLVKRNNGNVDV